MLLNFKLGAILLACSVVACAGSYFYGRWDGSAACDARHATAAAEDFQRRVAEGEVLSAALETDLAAGRNFSRILYRELDNEIATHDIYHSCVLPNSGLYIINSAVEGRAPR